MTRSALFIFVSFIAAAGCKKPEAVVEKPKEVALPPSPVETSAVEIRRMPKTLTLTGSIVAERQSEVAANVAGRVVVAPVERGQHVTAGQIMAVVDAKAAGLSAAAAAAQAKVADTQVSQAQTDCARAEQLFAQGALSKAEYDRSHSQCTAQLFSAKAAGANADLAAKLAGDTVIRAPFAGLVGERYVSAGEYVMPSSRVASVYTLDPVRVTISVPEPAVGLVHQGQLLNVRVAAYPDRDFPAVVQFVSPMLRTQTRDLIVEARARNVDGALRPGMFATALISVGEEALPTVPEDAIRDEGTVKRLFLAKETQAFELVVRTGAHQAGRVAVLEALDGKTRVIRHPPPGLRDGASIIPHEAPQGAATSPDKSNKTPQPTTAVTAQAER